MNIRIKLLLLFFIGGFLVLQAQPADVPAEMEWGPEYSEPRNSRITKVIDVTPKDYYVLRQRAAGAFSYPKVFVEHYGEEQNLLRSQRLELKFKGKRRTFEDVVKIGGKLYFFTSFLNQAHRMNYFFCQPLNDRLQPSRDIRKISEVPAPNQARPGTFNLLISKDSSKVLLYSQLDSKKKEPERFSLRVFDNKMQLQWKKEILLPYSEEQFSVEEYQVDEAGQVFLLCKQYLNGTRDRRGGRPNYQYVLLAYTSEGERKQEYRIAVKGRFVSDLTFRVGNDGNLVCAGFYSEQAADGIKGTCFFNIDIREDGVSEVKLEEFDFEFRSQGMSGGRARRAERAEQEDDISREAELFQYSLDRLILRSDGGAVLVAEQYFVTEQLNNFYGNRFWRYDPFFFNDPMLNNVQRNFIFHYNDIIVANIRPDGSIEWAARIPKFQRTMNDGGYYSSYSMAVVRDRLYFVFNDNSRNFESDGSQQLFNFNPRRSVIALAELRKDGGLSMYPLYSNRQAGTTTRPKICQQVGRRRMIIYGERGNGYRFGELNFE